MINVIIEGLILGDYMGKEGMPFLFAPQERFQRERRAKLIRGAKVAGASVVAGFITAACFPEDSRKWMHDQEILAAQRKQEEELRPDPKRTLKPDAFKKDIPCGDIKQGGDLVKVVEEASVQPGDRVMIQALDPVRGAETVYYDEQNIPRTVEFDGHVCAGSTDTIAQQNMEKHLDINH